MESEPLVTRRELEGAIFALYDLLNRSRVTMAKKKYKKIWDSKGQRDAWEAHVDETLRRLREAAESIRARGEKSAEAGEAGEPG